MTEPDQPTPQPGAVVKVARDLTEIVRMHDALLAQAMTKAADPQMPGGAAMVALGKVANMEAWENMQQATERYGQAYTSAQDEDPDEAWSAFQLIEFWSEAWRREHDAEYGQQPTIASEANFLRWLLDWAWDNEPHWDDFARDIAQARRRLEDILLAGERSERGAPCMYDECKGKRLVRKMIPARDAEGHKVWVQSDWHCPSCKRHWDEDAYARMVTAANHAAQQEDIAGQTWVSLTRAAKETGRSIKTIRTWVNRAELAVACIVRGRRDQFVSLDEVRERDEKARARKTTAA